jgi:hypothetical protein
MAKALTAYSDGLSYNLSRFYDYTENFVGNYNIVCVRIPPEMDSLNLTYTIFGDINGDGKVDIKDVAAVSKQYGKIDP